MKGEKEYAKHGQKEIRQIRKDIETRRKEINIVYKYLKGDFMTDQPGDYYVMEAVSWINSVEGLSEEDRQEGRECFAQLLAHHDFNLRNCMHSLDSFKEYLDCARREFSPLEYLQSTDLKGDK